MHYETLIQDFNHHSLLYKQNVSWSAFKKLVSTGYIARSNGQQHLGLHNPPVDGIRKTTSTVLQFHGRLFHGCQLSSCTLTRGIVINLINNEPFYQFQKYTKEKENFKSFFLH